MDDIRLNPKYCNNGQSAGKLQCYKKKGCD